MHSFVSLSSGKPWRSCRLKLFMFWSTITCRGVCRSSFMKWANLENVFAKSSCCAGVRSEKFRLRRKNLSREFFRMVCSVVLIVSTSLLVCGNYGA